uniref:HEAT repeat domain-containing protein n=1 Tax=candidate division WOR-3 bacterium TaxID=2052148 RepID=A0A7V1EHE8_UNCW3
MKRNGIYILGELKVRSTIEHLGRLLEDKDERMQLAAIESLNKIGGEGVYEYIKLGLKSTHRSVVILTMKSLPREDVKDKLLEVATWLKQRKSIPDEKEEQFRRSIIEVLGEKDDDTILEYLTAILEEKPFFKGELIQATKLSVLNAIAKIGTPKAIEILNNIANQKDPVLASTGRELLRKKRDALIT